MTTAEFLLARKLGKGSSPSIVVEALNVTSNGTYTAPSGKAYSPVTVEVQPPANSYQLKSITTPTSLATFEASAMPMPSLKASIKAQQAAGTPSPSNPLPISGWDAVVVDNASEDFFDATGTTALNTSAVNVTIINTKSINVKGKGTNSYPSSKQLLENYNLTNGKTYKIRAYASVSSGIPIISIRNSANTIVVNTDTSASGSGILELKFTYDSETMNYISFFSNFDASGGDITYSDIMFAEVVSTATIQFGQTVYGGELDVVNGTSGNKLTHDLIDVSSVASNIGYNAVIGAASLSNTGLKPNITSETINEYTSNCLRAHINSGVASINYEFTVDGNGVILFKVPNCASISDYQTWLANNPLQIKGPLATPTTFTTQPTPIKSLNGTNNLSVDCGDVIEGEYFKAL